MGVLADVCLAARGDAGDSEQGLALALDDTVSFLGGARREGDQRQTHPASPGKADLTRRPEYAVLVDGVDDPGRELGSYNAAPGCSLGAKADSSFWYGSMSGVQ